MLDFGKLFKCDTYNSLFIQSGTGKKPSGLSNRPEYVFALLQQ